MLLQLMVFLGNDRAEAIEKIQTDDITNEPTVLVEADESGYASLIFPYDKKQSWSYLGWALDELNIEIDDRDPVEGSYFIKVTPNLGFFSKLLSAVSEANIYQLIVKEVDEFETYVYFIDITEENADDTITYSFELFNQIASKF